MDLPTLGSRNFLVFDSLPTVELAELQRVKVNDNPAWYARFKKPLALPDFYGQLGNGFLAYLLGRKYLYFSALVIPMGEPEQGTFLKNSSSIPASIRFYFPEQYDWHAKDKGYLVTRF